MTLIEEAGEFLMQHYYPKYKGDRKDIIPSREVLFTALINAGDRLVIVKDDKIRGVAIFLTLSDESYNLLEQFDITEVDIVAKLWKEHGPNIHFILLCADGAKTIWAGMKAVIAKHNPKTISWWNPDLSHLHKYKIGRT